MSIESDLIKIVEGPGTKADKARALFSLGCEKRDVVELLDMAYSQALTLWRQGGYDSGDIAGGSNRGRHGRLVGQGEAEPELAAGKGGRQGHSRYLHLSPSQVRYVTQDGHVVVRVDVEGGAICQQCRAGLTFSLKYLGFVHSDSRSEPTDIQDHYSDEVN